MALRAPSDGCDDLMNVGSSLPNRGSSAYDQRFAPTLGKEAFTQRKIVSMTSEMVRSMERSGLDRGRMHNGSTGDNLNGNCCLIRVVIVRGKE